MSIKRNELYTYNISNPYIVPQDTSCVLVLIDIGNDFYYIDNDKIKGAFPYSIGDIKRCTIADIENTIRSAPTQNAKSFLRRADGEDTCEVTKSHIMGLDTISAFHEFEDGIAGVQSNHVTLYTRWRVAYNLGMNINQVVANLIQLFANGLIGYSVIDPGINSKIILDLKQLAKKSYDLTDDKIISEAAAKAMETILTTWADIKPIKSDDINANYLFNRFANHNVDECFYNYKI